MNKKCWGRSILLFIVLSLVMSGCSIERKVRFLRVSATETVLNLHLAGEVWVNDMVNGQHYRISQFDLEMEDAALTKVESNEGYILVLEFSAYHFGRYYHLQLFQNGESYVIGTVCYMASKSIPLHYNNQTFYLVSSQIVDQLWEMCKTFETESK